MSIEGLMKRLCAPRSEFSKQVAQGNGKIGKELNIFTYLRRVKRMDAALEVLLDKKKRTLIEYQDKVRYIIDALPSAG